MDVREWLNDMAKRGSLTEEERKLAESILTKPAVAQEIKDGFERQSEFSRKMAELQAEKAREDEYASRLAAWETDVKGEVATLKTQNQKYQEQLYRMATQYNVDPSELTEALKSAMPPVTPPVAKESAPVGVTKEEVENSAAALFKLNAKMIALNYEHMRLFGKPIDNIEGFVDHALSKGAPIEQTFREFFKVADREGEMREADVQARITKAVEDAKLQWATTAVNPLGVNTALPKGTQSPVFEALEAPQDGKIPGTDAAHRARVAEIVAAFNQSQTAAGLPTT